MRYLITTLAPAALVLVLTLQKGNGFLLILVLPVFLAYLLFNAVRMTRRPGERRSRGRRLAIWSVALGLACTVQTGRSLASRSEADSVLRVVQAFRDRAGTYPATLGEVGFDEVSLKEKWSIRYLMREGEPVLVYPAPFMPLTLCEYDFATRRWRWNAY